MLLTLDQPWESEPLVSSRAALHALEKAAPSEAAAYFAGNLGFGGLVTESVRNNGIAFLISPFSIYSEANSTDKLANVGEAEFARAIAIVNVNHGRHVAARSHFVHRREGRDNNDVAGLAA